MKHIGKEIKLLMDVKGLKRRELAKHLGMTEANVSKIYSKESIDTAQLQSICQFIGTPIDFFFDDTQTVFGPDLLKIDGNRNKTIAGNNNVLNEQANNTTIATLEEKVKMLEEMLRQANKLIEEKERFIQVLLSSQKK